MKDFNIKENTPFEFCCVVARLDQLSVHRNNESTFNIQAQFVDNTKSSLF